MTAQIWGPTASGSCYQALPKHRNKTPNASQWRREVTERDEFLLFQKAETQGDRGGSGCYWNCLCNWDPLGCAGEVMAQHPVPSNDTDCWHGYPERTRTLAKGDLPEKIVDRWESAGLRRSIGTQIRRRKI